MSKNIELPNLLYGFDTSSKELLDTHLIKNNEWAAVSYLSQSKYGLCVNENCKQLEINNSNYITGGSNYSNNVGQSTTNNVYDMYGGSKEFVMGNYNSTINALDGFSSLPDLKYLNIYNTEENYSM